MTHRIRLVHDYFVRWPVKIDGCYAEEVREVISAALAKDIEVLAEWWQDRFAVRITDPPTEPLAEDVRELGARNASILLRLCSELGGDYEVDPRERRAR